MADEIKNDIQEYLNGLNNIINGLRENNDEQAMYSGILKAFSNFLTACRTENVSDNARNLQIFSIGARISKFFDEKGGLESLPENIKASLGSLIGFSQEYATSHGLIAESECRNLAISSDKSDSTKFVINVGEKTNANPMSAREVIDALMGSDLSVTAGEKTLSFKDGNMSEADFLSVFNGKSVPEFQGAYIDDAKHEIDDKKERMTCLMMIDELSDEQINGLAEKFGDTSGIVDVRAHIKNELYKENTEITKNEDGSVTIKLDGKEPFNLEGYADNAKFVQKLDKEGFEKLVKGNESQSESQSKIVLPEPYPPRHYRYLTAADVIGALGKYMTQDQMISYTENLIKWSDAYDKAKQKEKDYEDAPKDNMDSDAYTKVLNVAYSHLLADNWRAEVLDGFRRSGHNYDKTKLANVMLNARRLSLCGTGSIFAGVTGLVGGTLPEIDGDLETEEVKIPDNLKEENCFQNGLTFKERIKSVNDSTMDKKLKTQCETILRQQRGRETLLAIQHLENLGSSPNREDITKILSELDNAQLGGIVSLYNFENNINDVTSLSYDAKRSIIEVCQTLDKSLKPIGSNPPTGGGANPPASGGANPPAAAASPVAASPVAASPVAPSVSEVVQTEASVVDRLRENYHCTDQQVHDVEDFLYNRGFDGINLNTSQLGNVLDCISGEKKFNYDEFLKLTDEKGSDGNPNEMEDDGPTM